jgi:hypothetical protein
MACVSGCVTFTDGTVYTTIWTVVLTEEVQWYCCLILIELKHAGKAIHG